MSQLLHVKSLKYLTAVMLLRFYITFYVFVILMNTVTVKNIICLIIQVHYQTINIIEKNSRLANCMIKSLVIIMFYFLRIIWHRKKNPSLLYMLLWSYVFCNCSLTLLFHQRKCRLHIGHTIKGNEPAVSKTEFAFSFL